LTITDHCVGVMVSTPLLTHYAWVVLASEIGAKIYRLGTTFIYLHAISMLAYSFINCHELFEHRIYCLLPTNYCIA